MESTKEDLSDEDIPSDFFDDFNKDEFMEGLSVIDSWDVKEGRQKQCSKSRINSAAFDSVRDLRELIRDSRGDTYDWAEKHENKKSRRVQDLSSERHSINNHHDIHSSQLDNYIKPGSRRDLRKTNEAIRKDKQVKVKEYLSKHLDSIEDLKPPGTELDDFLNEPSASSKRRNKSNSPGIQYTHYSRSSKDSKSWKSPHRENKTRERRSTHHSPPQYQDISHGQYPHNSTQHKYYHQRPNWRRGKNYCYSFTSRRSSRTRRSPATSSSRHSPSRRNSSRYSPSSSRHSPRRYSPRQRSPRRHSPRRYTRGRSQTPTRYSYVKKHTSLECKDTFLYPNETCQSATPGPVPNNPDPYNTVQGEFYSNPQLTEYSGGAPGYSYMQSTSYACAPYDYGAQTDPMTLALVQPASTTTINTVPAMVPPPVKGTSIIAKTSLPINLQMPIGKPYDALAKLVLEGKISKEDYLKLAPIKGTPADKPVATHVRVKVLDRCLEALAKLSKLELPNHLLVNNTPIGQETKSVAPKYCSPLKRQASVDFYFTKTNGELETVQHNRQVIDSIVSTVGLSDIVSRSKKKISKTMKDAAVQTTKPFCDVCQIRDSTKTYNAGTFIDNKDFSSTVHTQVLEQDLISSKTVFNPSGGATNSDPISIAYLTPAQLVSQLAARAKTLKQSQPMQQPQFRGRNPGQSYDYGGSGSNDETIYNYTH